MSIVVKKRLSILINKIEEGIIILSVNQDEVSQYLSDILQGKISGIINDCVLLIHMAILSKML